MRKWVVGRGWDEQRRDFLTYVVGRPLMFVFWAFILWGTLYLGVLVVGAIAQGRARTWHQTLSGKDPLAGIANLVLAGSVDAGRRCGTQAGSSASKRAEGVASRRERNEGR